MHALLLVRAVNDVKRKKLFRALTGTMFQISLIKINVRPGASLAKISQNYYKWRFKLLLNF